MEQKMLNWDFTNGTLTRKASFYEEYEEFYKSEGNISIKDFSIMKKINGTIPGYMSHFEIVAIYCIYLFIFIIGTISNVITCIVIVKNPAMRNATNYYLLSLAVSDILIATCGAIVYNQHHHNELRNYPWRWGNAGCKIIYFFRYVGEAMSILTVFIFTIERYLAILHPYSFNAWNGVNRAIKVIFLSWAFAFIFSFSTLLKFHVEKYYLRLPYAGQLIELDYFLVCTYLSGKAYSDPLHFYWTAASVTIYLVSLTITMFLYVTIWIKIRNYSENSSSLFAVENAQIIKRYRESNKITFIMMTMTFTLWSPKCISGMMFLYQGDINYMDNIYFMSARNLIFLSSTIINPITYNIMSTQYREGFKQILCCNKNLKTEIVKEVIHKVDKTTTSV